HPDSWTVPDGVTLINLDLQGANGAKTFQTGNPGRGGKVQATVAVTPGQSLQLDVGCRGGLPPDRTTAGGAGGFNGGGTGGVGGLRGGGGIGGGGATDVRMGGTGLENRIAVAGGGGGAGGPGLRDLGRAGGAGGGSQGQPGADGSGPVAGGGGGGGGTQNSVGGPGFHGGFAGTGATGGTGGAGTVGAGNGTGGGGGGGGYFGGGGGGAGSGSGDFPGGGGGGGSAFGPPGSILTSGVADGPEGLAVIVTNPGSAPTLSGNPTPATILHPYSYSFMVAGSPAPNVVVSEGTLPPGLSLSLGGQLSGTPQTAGRYPFTVAASNGVLPNASLPAVIVVTGAPARVALSSSANPAEFSQPVTLSALVSPNSSTVHLPVPTGTVQFFDGTESLGTANLVGAGGGDATATLGALTALPVATHTIMATYSGDSVFAPITGPPLSQVIANVATVTKVASSANPADFDQAITFTATVLRHGPASVEPTGSVVFTIDGASRPAVVLQNGSAALTPLKLPTGQHTVRAEYVPTGNFSQSGDTLAPAQEVKRASTTSSISSSANPATTAQQVTVSATVTAVAPAVGTPTGSVELYVDSKKVGDKQLDGAGRTSFVLPKLEVGGHDTYAIYRGDREFGQSVSQPIVQVIESS
ncbi:MAG TPA: Ig-like domain-containing protein, partial [Acidimicrobiales bacterium]